MISKNNALIVLIVEITLVVINDERENRTPGSVRGLSGNWQSYRVNFLLKSSSSKT